MLLVGAVFCFRRSLDGGVIKCIYTFHVGSTHSLPYDAAKIQLAIAYSLYISLGGELVEIGKGGMRLYMYSEEDISDKILGI
jgi:hypothetical protein